MWQRPGFLCAIMWEDWRQIGAMTPGKQYTPLQASPSPSTIPAVSGFELCLLLRCSCSACSVLLLLQAAVESGA